LTLNNNDVLSHLITIGSLEDDCTVQTMLLSYRMSQWDALNIAIRYELAQEMEHDSNIMDIQKSINKLKPNNDEY